MKVISIGAALLLAAGFVVAGSVGNEPVEVKAGVGLDIHGNIVTSVEALSRFTPRRTGWDVTQADSTGSIDFDDVSPCFFSQTNAIDKKLFKNYQIQFKGPGGLDGPAILDECGGFGVTGQSSPNFLAFNCGGGLESGGTPVGPTTLIFKPAVSSVSLKVGDGISPGQTLRLTAYGKKVVDEQLVILQAAMQTVVLSGTKKIKRVVIGDTAGGDPCIYVVDDITFVP